MAQFLADYAGGGQWAYDEGDTPKREAYFHANSTQRHATELEVYGRLVDLQGAHVPTLFADVRLTPEHSATGLDESLTEYTGIPAILTEYLPSFLLCDLFKETTESDWPAICDQAIEAARKVIDHDFVHLDLTPKHALVRCGEEPGSYQYSI
ncbi:hypothetical protein PG994_000032 [Apiospora phragmitis]|uniref:Protein kinase domain-containing protein n=1 Tax=Apiospora phragmitis TaxID=2905665 RepID=A0ABR1X591_9PEZI